MAAIDDLKPPPRPSDLPLRFSIADIFKTHSLGGCVAGRVEGGNVSVGAAVVCRPGDLAGQVLWAWDSSVGVGGLGLVVEG